MEIGLQAIDMVALIVSHKMAMAKREEAAMAGTEEAQELAVVTDMEVELEDHRDTREEEATETGQDLMTALEGVAIPPLLTATEVLTFMLFE